jgi:hypothetical protein
MPTMMKSTDFVPDHGAMPLEWGGYIIRPSDEKHSSYAGFPNEPGIYAMYSRVGDLMYVGRSVAIATRLRQHAQGTYFFGGSPSMYSFKLVPEPLITAVEVAHIKALEPPENVLRESGGKISLIETMVPAIHQIWAYELPRQRARLDTYYRETAEQIAARL